ncbi:MAG TPA: ABC transporter ATP-binding protein [Bacillota bacterium]|nr:ABC transporter ATP-binding protein [Bacillota bacterium]
MLVVSKLTKKYGKMYANREVSFSLEKGEIGVLLGPNGAGKSTAIKCILGLLRFEGEITIGGFSNKTSDAKRIIGYVPEMPAPYELLTVGEHFEFIIRAYKLDYESSMEYAEELMQRFQLTEKRDSLAKNLSKGMQQKISIICALLPRPQMLLLDEPLVGLDPYAIKQIKALILELKEQGTAILVSTHMIDSVEGIWDKAFILMKGRIVASHAKEDFRGVWQESLERIFFAATESIANGDWDDDEDRTGDSDKRGT